MRDAILQLTGLVVAAPAFSRRALRFRRDRGEATAGVYDVGPMDRQAVFFRELGASGLQRIAERLRRLMRPCVEISTRVMVDGERHVGSSRLGGDPDLPRGARWPTWRGIPLAFLCQLDLASLRRFPCCAALPQQGLLTFFYDPQQRTWGFDPDDRESWRVLWSQGTELQRHSPPTQLPARARYRPCAVQMTEQPTFPSVESMEIQDLSLTSQEKEFYWEVLAATRKQTGWSRHQLLGHADPIQEEMRLDCQLASNGVYCCNAEDYEGQQATMLARGAGEWQLLLQLGSDDLAGMMWADAGRLYFWMREADLRAAGFERAWMALQCF